MHSKRAKYDENGDIILPEDDAPVRASVRVTEEHAAPKQASTQETVLHKATTSLLLEGKRQWSASVADTNRATRTLRAELQSGCTNIWKALQQPVWIPGRRGQPKRYTRGTLFLIDTVRFGVTFAGIFGLLFLSLNYQSFLAIAQATLDPLAAASAGDVMQTELADGALTASALPQQKNMTDKRSLLAMLPQVGPPDDRIIIPKLNLNVPIVIPSSDSLVQENWKQLELDIQAALADGVVHYPGTARPGQAGNFFVTGHSSYYPWAEGDYKSVFARLGELKVGDEYWVYYGGDKHRYRIESKKEVSPSDVSVLDQPTNQRRSTLMTCTPVGTTLRRLIVSAQELHNDTGEPIAVGEHEKRKDGQKLQMEQLPI